MLLIEFVVDLYSDEREDCEDEAGQTQQDQQCHLDVTLNVNSIYKCSEIIVSVHLEAFLQLTSSPLPFLA